jgi:hypothetical protein
VPLHLLVVLRLVLAAILLHLLVSPHLLVVPLLVRVVILQQILVLLHRPVVPLPVPVLILLHLQFPQQQQVALLILELLTHLLLVQTNNIKFLDRWKS